MDYGNVGWVKRSAPNKKILQATGSNDQKQL